MNITNPMRQMILNALRVKKMTKVDLSNQIGLGKSWVTKLLDGSLKSIKEDHIDALENALGISFFSVVENDKVSNKSLEMAKRIESDPELSNLVNQLLETLNNARGAFTPRFIPTAEMSRTGEKIIAIVEDNKQKPGKVARLVLELLA
jgi:DNA-binding Xre family transcriptional regulator